MISAAITIRSVMRSRATSTRITAATSSLSAIGSRKRPKSVCSPQRRATQPSSQSVKPMIVNTTQAVHAQSGPSR
jgi:hypothetical protein